jgi:hypothetical protein
MAVSITALVFATTGSAFAAKTMITGADVKNGTITSEDIKDGTLSTRDIEAGSINLDRLSDGTQRRINERPRDGVNGTDGVKGTDGAKGAAGAKGDKGDAGVPGPTGAQGAAGPAGPQGVVGPQGPKGTSGALPQDFNFTNSSVRLTDAGVQFGAYPDGGAAGGSLYYEGLNGSTLADIANLYYTAEYTTGNDVDTAVPYLRVFLNNDTTDVIFSPNTQPDKQTAEGVSHKWIVNEGTVRYGDDPGAHPDAPWADVVAAHGTDVISGIYVTTGFSAGTNLKALLTDFGVNGQAFSFPQG